MLDIYAKFDIIKQIIRKMVFFRNDQARDIELQAKREQRYEAEVIRELIDKGLEASRRVKRETTGEALLRLAKLGEELQVKLPADLSTRIDEYLYDDK